jgi:hypothetical protein
MIAGTRSCTLLPLPMHPPMPVIVGVPRSGTTLLRMMLDAHSALAIPPETGFLLPLAALDSAAGDGRAAAAAITRAETWPDFHLDATAFEAAIARLTRCTPAEVARTFYRMYASRFGKARWGDKTPAYGTAIDQIAALLPEAHIVHIIRDGRDVMLSVRGLWFRPGDTVEACAEDWARRVARTREIGQRLPRYLEVRYESLVTSPETTLKTICRFIDLAFEPAMLRYHERAGSRLAGRTPPQPAVRHGAAAGRSHRPVATGSDRRRGLPFRGGRGRLAGSSGVRQELRPRVLDSRITRERP